MCLGRRDQHQRSYRGTHARRLTVTVAVFVRHPPCEASIAATTLFLLNRRDTHFVEDA
jgi:hypothetical protein